LIGIILIAATRNTLTYQHPPIPVLSSHLNPFWYIYLTEFHFLYTEYFRTHYGMHQSIYRFVIQRVDKSLALLLNLSYFGLN